MGDLHPWFDVSHHPIIVFTCPERFDDEAQIKGLYDSWCDWLSKNPKPFVAILDASRIKAFPRAKARSALAEGEKTVGALEARFNKGAAYVICHPIARSLVAAMYWLSRPQYPYRFFATFAEAQDWVLHQLESAGVPRPAVLPHRTSGL